MSGVLGFKRLGVRGLSGGVASVQRDQILMTHEHENREFLHGDECVVGVFALAYLKYYTLFASINQRADLLF